jgi:hypothetical protein
MNEQPVETSEQFREQIESDEELRGELEALPEVADDPTAPPEPEEGRVEAEEVDGYNPYYGEVGNDCGQAAIAGILDYWDVNLGGMGPGPWPPDKALAQVKADGYGPNMPIQGPGAIFGTNGDQIAAALRHYGGQQVGIGFAGIGVSPEQCFQIVRNWVDNRWPVPVLVQANYIMPVPGGPWPTGVYGHWPIVTKVDGQSVWLSNVSRGGDPISVTHNGFMSAWNYLGGFVHGYHHAFVVGRKQ